MQQQAEPRVIKPIAIIGDGKIFDVATGQEHTIATRRRRPLPDRLPEPGGWSVRAVPVPARPMLTVREDDLIWNPETAADAVPLFGADVKGAIVRLFPPMGVDPTEFRTFCEDMGAARVVVIGAIRERVVMGVDPEEQMSAARPSIRDVVTKMTDEAPASKHYTKAELAEELDGLLSAEGL